MTKFIKKILLPLLLVWVSWVPTCAQQDTVPIPDFERGFQILGDNRIVYNQFNDSIFLIKDHDQWVNFFCRRAVRNHQIYASNQEVIRTITDYFNQPKSKISDNAYVKLYNAYNAKYLDHKMNDPFLTHVIANIMEDFNKRCPDSLNTSNVVNLWQVMSYMQMWNLVRDSTLMRKAYDYNMRLLTEQAKRYPVYAVNYASALANLLTNTWLTYHIETISEYNHYRKLMGEFLQRKDIDSLVSPQFKAGLERDYKMIDENLIRNVYMNDTTVMEKQKADSLMRVVVNRNLADPSLSIISYVRTLLMQVKLKQITAKEARELAIKKHEKHWKEIKNAHMDAREFTFFLTPFFTFFYINDVAEVSYAQKRHIVLKMCEHIEQAFQNRKDQQYSTDYVRLLSTLTTYNRITKYLKPQERVRFLNSLNVATQVTTYAHSVHVSMIATELMKGLLKYQPELLVGSLGDLQITDVLANKKKYLSFIHDAAMYHDLGKNSIISVVNNDYRPLTDEEFAIIKRHPEFGLEYLKLSPNLAKFHDTTLGHHKWYNGKGGYPASFDNTKSPMRFMIDIVTLSDCMQAATERVGRNYKGEKTFDNVMAEFRRDAGVRYNPDLVAFIDAHEDVAKKLAHLVNEGWAEIYYQIYSDFLNKNWSVKSKH